MYYVAVADLLVIYGILGTARRWKRAHLASDQCLLSEGTGKDKKNKNPQCWTSPAGNVNLYIFLPTSTDFS